MTWRLIRPADHRVMPWKNGHGTTREIAVDPPGAALSDRFRWRLSIAEVGRSGPFSAFPGYDRTIMLIGGAGMELTVDGRPPYRLDRPYEPFAFSGDASTGCRLIDGPVRDFNLMTDRAVLRSRLEVLRLGPSRHRIDAGQDTWIVHCCDGVTEIAEGPFRLPAGHTAVLESAAVWQLSAGADSAVAAVIALSAI